ACRSPGWPIALRLTVRYSEARVADRCDAGSTLPLHLLGHRGSGCLRPCSRWSRRRRTYRYDDTCRPERKSYGRTLEAFTPGAQSVLHHGLHINLDQNAGAREAIHNEPGARRKDALEALAHHLIDRLAIGTIRDIDG